MDQATINALHQMLAILRETSQAGGYLNEAERKQLIADVGTQVWDRVVGKPEPGLTVLNGSTESLSLKVLAIACPTPPFSFSATSKHTHYNSATNSPRAQGDENEEGDRNEEIIEVPDMIDYENPLLT